MAAIKGKNTKPEIAVRRYLHRSGLRYALHDTNLPGSPDIVFRARRAVLFVHGCFWHRCPYCHVARKTIRINREYWLPKLRRNQMRDKHVIAALRADGWTVFVLWECQVTSQKPLRKIAERVQRMPILY